MNSKIEISEFIKSIPKKEKLKLNSGNCGIFAIALKRIFGKGKLVAVLSDQEPEMFIHVALNIEDKYYDGEGIKSKEELVNDNYIADWEMQDPDYKEPKFTLAEVGEYEAEKYTEPTMEIDELLNELQVLGINILK